MKGFRVESTSDANLSVLIKRKDGSVESVVSEEVAVENLPPFMRMYRYTCKECTTSWIEDAAESDKRGVVFCPGCGNKEEF